MSTRHVTFLGTSSQVPTRARNHNALFLHWEEFGLLVDPGEGTQRQMLLAGLSATQITHILITHFHGDHCLGLAGIIQRLSLDRVPHPVEVIYPASGQVFFERLHHASSFYEVATLIPRPISARPDEDLLVARLGKASLITRSLEHGIDCQGYRLQEDDGRRMLPEKLAAAGIHGPAVRRLLTDGQLVVGDRLFTLDELSERRPGQTVSIVMDTRTCPGALALAQNADLLVCEATYQQSEAREAFDRYHMTAAAAAELAAAAHVRRLALTHFSQRYQTLDGFRDEAAAIHPEVFCADDLDRIALPPRRESHP